MRRFAELYDALDRTTSTNAKVAAIAAYVSEVPPGDAAWALFFLTGRRLKRLLPARLLHQWTVELTALPEWLVQESYGAVGDHAEAIALLLDGRVEPIDVPLLRRTSETFAGGPTAPAPGPADALPRRAVQRGLFDAEHREFPAHVHGVGLQDWIEQRLLPLRTVDAAEQRIRVAAWWSRLDTRERFLLNKLMTGEFRVGVSRTLVVRAIADCAGLPAAAIEHRLSGDWEPSAAAFLQLLDANRVDDEPSRPYPFSLASPFVDAVETLGPREEWLAEWKWDGIRAQLIVRSGGAFLWSRGDELITTRFPEVLDSARPLPPGTVLDGEILAWSDGRPRPFSDLQHRIGRERSVREIARTLPAVFVAFDLLEQDGIDVRTLPLQERRERLQRLVGDVTSSPDSGGAPLAIRLSEAVDAPTWAALEGMRDQSRARHVEGVMLKRWSSPYRPGRRRGDWWKWKVEPYTVDAVLIYAQPGSGRRATLFTDYTFGVWHQGELVPVAKAYSGLSDAEIDELDRWIRRHTVERFGPVSAVAPVHVFELGFDRIARSDRHKSGVALRFPRMLRWRTDKPADQADTLETLMALLPTA